MKPSLPLDLILNVIDCLAAPGDSVPVALKPSHDITRTLRALSLCTRSLHSVATKHLYRRCLWIDSTWRLDCLTRTLTSVDVDEEKRQAWTACATSCFLSTWDGYDVSHAQDLIDLGNMNRLLELLRPVLTRLVIGIPVYFHFTCYTALGRLETLRELMCFGWNNIFDEFCPRPVGLKWPRLGKIAVVATRDIGSKEFWANVAASPQLDEVFIIYPRDVIRRNISALNGLCRYPRQVTVVHDKRGDNLEWFAEETATLKLLAQRFSAIRWVAGDLAPENQPSPYVAVCESMCDGTVWGCGTRGLN